MQIFRWEILPLSVCRLWKYYKDQKLLPLGIIGAKLRLPETLRSSQQNHCTKGGVYASSRAVGVKNWANISYHGGSIEGPLETSRQYITAHYRIPKMISRLTRKKISCVWG